MSATVSGSVDWLNYHHLLYFWTTAREGGLVPAAKKLHVSHPTISTQIKKLEEALGQPLFDRSRRSMVLTEAGKTVFEYAQEIFSLGNEMQDVLRGGATGRPLRLVVGITDAMPKLIVRSLLRPALALDRPIRFVFREDRTDRVLAELALGNLDVVLADTPVPTGSGLRAYNHKLGECDIAFFAHKKRVRKLKAGFPQSLNGVPFLAPTQDYVLRRALEAWFETIDVHPDIVAEFEDSALLKVIAQDDFGVFAAPSVMSDAIRSQYGLHEIGRTHEVQESFYAITMSRRLRNPAVIAICEEARHKLFSDLDNM